MSLRLILCATAVIGLAVPVQAVLAHPVSVQAVEQEDLDMEETSARFEERMEALKAELETVVATHAGHPEALAQNVDLAIARYKDDIDAFASMIDTYFATKIESAETDAKKQEYQSVREEVVPMLRTLPEQIRTSTLERANAPK